jgi:hypothetical protein
MTSDLPPPKARPPAAPSAREARLAEALRANLRRRKAEARAKAAEPRPAGGRDGESA